MNVCDYKGAISKLKKPCMNVLKHKGKFSNVDINHAVLSPYFLFWIKLCVVCPYGIQIAFLTLIKSICKTALYYDKWLDTTLTMMEFAWGSIIFPVLNPV